MENLFYSMNYLVFGITFDKKWQIIDCIGIFHSREVFNINRKNFCSSFIQIVSHKIFLINFFTLIIDFWINYFLYYYFTIK
jgi:type IV secretory pathway TrbL component